ncbi:MAG: recombination-associated protein RdgC [Desulfosudaceae bacterium]
MGLLTTRTSITCYRVEGGLPSPVAETVHQRLKKNLVAHIDDQPAEKAVGWSSFEKPFAADLDGSSIQFGALMAFTLRIDKKAIPAKVIKKYCDQQAARRLAQKGQATLSKNEKQQIREKVLHELALRIPATPRAYDLAWDYEAGRLWFFSNMKNANEELETLFFKTFSLRLIRLFPYTIAALEAGLSDQDKDRLFTSAPTNFME